MPLPEREGQTSNRSERQHTPVREALTRTSETVGKKLKQFTEAGKQWFAKVRAEEPRQKLQEIVTAPPYQPELIISVDTDASEKNDTLEILHTKLKDEYNLTEDDLLPEKYLVSQSFSLPKEAHEALVNAIELNPENLVRDMKDEFLRVQAESKATFLGVEHIDTSGHHKIAEYIGDIKDKENTIIDIELPIAYQDTVNKYLETGKFRETDDPELYEKIYEEIYKNESYELPPSLQGTFFDDDEGFVSLQLYPILNTARLLREHGIQIPVTIFDKFHDNANPEREQGMYEILSGQIKDGKKPLIIAGENHCRNLDNEAEVDTDRFQYENDINIQPSVAKLLKEEYGDQVKSFIFNNFDHHVEIEDLARNSVLYDAYRKKFGTTSNAGLLVDNRISPDRENIAEEIGADYYIPIFLTQERKPEIAVVG